mgnify:CR=1 FL=1
MANIRNMNFAGELSRLLASLVVSHQDTKTQRHEEREVKVKEARGADLESAPSSKNLHRILGAGSKPAPKQNPSGGTLGVLVPWCLGGKNFNLGGER